MSRPPSPMLQQLNTLQKTLQWDPFAVGTTDSQEYLVASAQMMELLPLAHPDDIIASYSSGRPQNLATLLVVSDCLVEKKDQISSESYPGAVAILHPLSGNSGGQQDVETIIQIHKKLLPLLPPNNKNLLQLFLNAAATYHPDVLRSLLPFVDPSHQSHAALFQAARDNRSANVAVLLSVSDPDKAITSRVSNLPLSPDADVVMRLFSATQVLAPHLSDDTWEVLKKKRVSIRPTHLNPIQAALKHPIDFPDIPEFKAYLLKDKLASQMTSSETPKPPSRSSKM